MKIRKLAAIDIGSNAMRLLINFVYEEPGQLPIFNKTSIVRMPIRLGHDVFLEGEISEANVERISDAMQAYALMMKVYEVEHYRAFATSAMREALNGTAIVEQVKQRTGVQIEIIDGKTESELVFSTELGAFIQNDKSYLYVDVGGGSTELTLLKNGKVVTSQSFQVGTVRLLENRVEKGTFSFMKQWIEENIQEEVELIGTGGNINHVFKYSGTKIGKPLNAQYLYDQYNALQSLTSDERMHDFNMKPDRADVVVYALEIYTNVIRWSKTTIIHVPKIGLSDGMIRVLYKEISNQ